ncbi:MAG: transporter [Anaerolineae bacterium]|nr:transporter [Anaerolineae bacterium]
MDNPLLRILMFALLPVAATIIGGIAATFRPPGPRLRSYLQHFAAGVVFSVVAVELLPDIVRVHLPSEVGFGFALGVGVMLGLRWTTQKLAPEEANIAGQPLGLIVGVAVDVLIDGLLIGIGFAAGASAGALLTFALTVELLSLGLAVSAALGKSGMARRQTIITIILLALLVLVGATAGATLLQSLPNPALEIVLSFGLAALLYLVTEELLTEAHEEPETLLATTMFFGGFLLFLLLGMFE